MSEGFIPEGEQLRLLQLNELELLVEVDRICRKNGIKYSLDGGTMLGAVRHKGFIPWDDDADVIFTREEYEKFFIACQKDMNKERFFLQDYRTDKGYRWGYAKMRLLGTEYVKIGQEKEDFLGGVCIDVFVVDNVPDNTMARKYRYAVNVVLRKILYSELGKKEANSTIKRLGFTILNVISKDTVYKIRNRYCEKANRQSTALRSHLLFPYPKKTCKYGMPSECFDTVVEMEYEGMMFSVMEKYDQYLTLLYGDYMKMPPVEKQKGNATLTTLSLIDTSIEQIHEKYQQNNK